MERAVGTRAASWNAGPEWRASALTLEEQRSTEAMRAVGALGVVRVWHRHGNCATMSRLVSDWSMVPPRARDLHANNTR